MSENENLYTAGKTFKSAAGVSSFTDGLEPFFPV